MALESRILLSITKEFEEVLPGAFGRCLEALFRGTFWCDVADVRLRSNYGVAGNFQLFTTWVCIRPGLGNVPEVS